MLGYFPTPYDDELLYSVIARYAKHTGMAGNQKAVVREVFSSATATAVPDLPSHLNSLAKNLQLVWPISANTLCSTYTLAPFYLPFLSPQQAINIFRSMQSNSGGNIHTRSGIAANVIKQPESFRYCPKCMTEQLEKYGELYWCRMHQLPGLDFCLHHLCFLEHTSIHFHAREKHLFVAATDVPLNNTIRNRKVNQNESALYLRYEELLCAKQLKGFGVNRWATFYRGLATKYGLMKKSRVDHQEINKLLKKVWSGTRYETYFRDKNESYWLLEIFRKHRKSFHPLKHLLVTTALAPDLSVKQIFQKVHGYPDQPVELSVIHTTISPSQNNICKHRTIWKKLVTKHPDVGVKVLRGMNRGGATYAWLYRHDRLWLRNNSPRRKPSAIRHFSADYQAWDSSNVAFLKSNYQKIKSHPDRQRLSKAKFIKALPRSGSVDKHLSDLPETTKWLAAHEETVEEYQVYRLNNAYQYLVENNVVVKRWRLLRVASIRYELITLKIEAEILRLELRRR